MNSKNNNEKSQEHHDDHEISVPVPPDGGYGWVVVFASFVCNMMVDGITYCFGIFLPILMQEFSESQATISWVGSILAGVTMCTGPLVSAVVNKYGCRVSCMAGATIAAASFAASTFSPNVQTLMLVYGVGGGIGFGLMYVPAVVCVGYYFESKRSLATGIAVCGSGVGTIIFPPIETWLLNRFGWKGAFLVIASLCLPCILFGFLMKPIEYKTELEVDEQEHENDKTATILYQNGNGLIKDDKGRSYTSLRDVSASKLSLASNRSKRSHHLPPLSRQDVLYTGSLRNLKEFQSQKSLQDFRQSMLSISKKKSRYSRSGLGKLLNELIDFNLMKNPVFVAIALSNLIGFMALYVPFVYIGEAAKKNGLDTDQAAMLISFIGITNTVGRIVCGFVADFPKVNTLLVNNLCQLVMAVAIAAAAFCKDFIAYSIKACVYGSSMAGYISLTSILLVEFLGLEKLTSAFGLLILFRGTGALLGPPLAGAIINLTGGYTVTFLVASAFFTVSTAISFAIPCIQKYTKTNRHYKPKYQLNLDVINETA